MENNQTDFMKNRPVAAPANQIKDVFGSQKKSTFTTVSAVLSVITFVLMMIAIFTCNRLMMVIFIPVFIVLMISFFVAKRADRQNAPVEKTEDNKEALFKDHDV
jgi:ABC-type bacteriocin/lantibiotic exporter with double-glycine peptidase domain